MTENAGGRWKPFNLYKKLYVFRSGLRIAIQNDRNVAIQMLLSLAVLALTFGLRAWLDFVIITIVTGYMLVVEMINTAIEAICDYVQPEHDPRIGAIKDVAAAASGIAITLWIAVMLYEGVRIWNMLG
ncbi:MAG: diacylglycerol kinase [Caldilineaceae bacterium]